MRDYLGELLPECVGPKRPLSRSLYRLAHEFVQLDCIGEVFKLSHRWDRDATLEHLLLLPDPAYQRILGGFRRALLEQSESPGEDLVIECQYLAADLSSGWGFQTLAPKTWAAAFFADAMQRRPLPDGE